MAEQEFIVRALLEFEYRVKAESADDAERLMEEGELADKGTCVGFSVDAVVSADKRGDYVWDDEDDLRARCRCGHLIVNEHTGSEFGEREQWATFTERCSAFRCDCLAPVEVVKS